MKSDVFHEKHLKSEKHMKSTYLSFSSGCECGKGFYVDTLKKVHVVDV